MASGKNDEMEGEVKDVSGRVERQAGEWTGDKKSQVRGAAKQAEGKAQKIMGKAKDKADEAELQNPIKKKQPKKAA